MNRVLGLLTLCVAFAVLRAVLVVLVAGAALALLYAFLTRTRDTAIFVVTVGLVGLASVQPLAFILTLGAVALVVGVAAAVRRHDRRRRSLPVLLIGRDAEPEG